MTSIKSGSRFKMAVLLVMSLMLLNLGPALADPEEEESVEVDGIGSIDVGMEAPDFTAVSVDGAEYKLSDLKGAPVIIDFWATWCPPCRESIPGLNEFSKEYGEKVTVLGITIDNAEGEEKVMKFIEDYGLTYPIIHDPVSAIYKAYDFKYIPTMVIVDSEGVIQDIHIGFEPADDLYGEIAEELGLTEETED